MGRTAMSDDLQQRLAAEQRRLDERRRLAESRQRDGKRAPRWAEKWPDVWAATQELDAQRAQIDDEIRELRAEASQHNRALAEIQSEIRAAKHRQRTIDKRQRELRAKRLEAQMLFAGRARP